MIRVKYYRTSGSYGDTLSKTFENEKEMIDFGIQENKGRDVIIRRPFADDEDAKNLDYEMEIYDDYRE